MKGQTGGTLCIEIRIYFHSPSNRFNFISHILIFLPFIHFFFSLIIFISIIQSPIHLSCINIFCFFYSFIFLLFIHLSFLLIIPLLFYSQGRTQGGAAGLLPPPELPGGGHPLGICPLLGENLLPPIKIIVKAKNCFFLFNSITDRLY